MVLSVVTDPATVMVSVMPPTSSTSESRTGVVWSKSETDSTAALKPTSSARTT
jgi:hypothetical protein